MNERTSLGSAENPATAISDSKAGAILWLTGYSGAGKTTISALLEAALQGAGARVCILDGDDIRRGLNSDLGFSPEDREENLRRIAEVARLMARTGLIVIVAFISPFRKSRRRAREIALASGLTFIEVFIDCPLAVCEQRDPKGLYKKARAGTIAQFTGISADYEPPEHAEITLHTAEESPGECVSKIMAWLGVR